MPMPIKFKRVGNEEAMGSRQREHNNNNNNNNNNRRDRYHHDLGKTTTTTTTRREPPSLEIGPKRLKVRGPSFLGWESRLD